MTIKENYIRAVRFETPDYIPMRFSINDSCWNHYPQEFLAELIESHPLIFQEIHKPKLPYHPVYKNVARKDEPYTDDFGCVWKTAEDGITGTVISHPLENWEDLKHYKIPNPEKVMGIGEIDWDAEALNIKRDKKAGKLIRRGLRHGHTFLQLCDIRGYQELLFDMTDEEPRLFRLIESVESFNLHIVKKYIDLGADIITYAEDLGMQVGPMLSPEHFRTYIKPTYQRLMEPARAAGKIVHMHSDGDIRLLAEELIEGGVDIINLQDMVNGIDWIAGCFAGKVCVDLDIDRQFVTTRGTPKEIDELIREEVSKIGCKKGGLAMVYGLYAGLPLENVKAVADAMERYALYYN